MKNKHVALFVLVLLVIAGGLFLWLTNMSKNGGAALFRGLPAPTTCPASGYKYVTQWGSEGVSNGQFSGGTRGVALDSLGNVYVVDNGNNRVQKFGPSGSYIAQWGTLGSGNGQFDFPLDVAIDSMDDVYITEAGNNRVQKFSSTGSYITQWGTTGSGNGQFHAPRGIALDGSGNVYVADLGNNRVQKFTSAGVYITQWGTNGSGNGQFRKPWDIVVDLLGNVYVADIDNHRIQKFTSTGSYITQWGTFGSGNGQFFNPSSIDKDTAGNIYVVDMSNYRIQKFTSAGTYITQFGERGTGNGQFKQPHSIAVNSVGQVYVSDWQISRVQKFAPCTPSQGPAPVVVPSKLIRGKVYNDRNTNGTFDGSDTALANAKVSLFPLGQNTPIQTVTASSAGEYSFTNLADGTYYVGLWSETYYSNITQPATGSGIIPAHAHIYTITITNGQGAVNKDFGVVAITTY